MKRESIRKEYGVDGYMDYVAEIRTGKAVHQVHFTGGTESGFGRTPAKFVTGDIVMQLIIERSAQFKSGRIRLLSGKPWEDCKISSSPKLGADDTFDKPAAPFREAGAIYAAPTGNDGSPQAGSALTDETRGGTERAVDAGAAAGGGKSGKRERVECGTLGDAQVVLKERFGVASSRAHNRERAIALGKEQGIEIVFK